MLFRSGGGDDRTRSRLTGFAAAIKRVSGASLTKMLLPAGTSFQGGRQALAQLLASEPNLHAVFCSNDALAVGALMECRRRGIEVPRDLAIAGFADLDIAAEVTPTLTSVHVGARRIGEEAARMMLARLTGQAIAMPLLDLGFKIKARESA